MSLSGLPSPAPPGIRQLVVLAVELDRRLAPDHRAHESRTRASGRSASGTAARTSPSTTCGPEAPTPRISRPPERWSIVMAVIATQAGVRAESCMMPVPSLILRRTRAHPAERRHAVRAVGLGGPNRVEAELLGFVDQVDRVFRARHPVSEHQTELHSAPLRPRKATRTLPRIRDRCTRADVGAPVLKEGELLRSGSYVVVYAGAGHSAMHPTRLEPRPRGIQPSTPHRA